MQPIQRRMFAPSVAPELRGTPAARILGVVARLEATASSDLRARENVAQALATLRPETRFTTVALLAEQPPIDGQLGLLTDVGPALAAFRQGPNDPPAVLGIHSVPNPEGPPQWATGTFEGRPLLSVSNLPDSFAENFKFEAAMLVGVDATLAAQQATAQAQIAQAQAHLNQMRALSGYQYGVTDASALQGGPVNQAWNAVAPTNPALFDTSLSPAAAPKIQAEPVVPVVELAPPPPPVVLTPEEARARRDQVLETARQQLAARRAAQG